MVVLPKPIKRELPEHIARRLMVVELHPGFIRFESRDRGLRGTCLGKAHTGKPQRSKPESNRLSEPHDAAREPIGCGKGRGPMRRGVRMLGNTSHST